MDLIILWIALFVPFILVSLPIGIGYMKKGYKKPSAFAVQLETEVIMTTTSAEQGSANVGNKPVGGNTPDLSGNHRGEWGNLW